MRRTLKYRLYTSKKDKHLIEQIEVAASIWNHSVALTRRYFRRYGKSISTNRLQKHIAKLRRRNPYWRRLGSQAVQDVCQRLDKAYQRFFSDPQRVGRPGFKKRRCYTSFTLKVAGWANLGAGRVRLGKREYRFVESRPITGQIKTVTIKRDRAGRLWILFSILEANAGDLESPIPGPHEEVMHPVGLDFGLKTFLTLSDGTQVASPQYFKASLKEIRKGHRDLSRKQKGSRHRAEARRRLALAYDRITKGHETPDPKHRILPEQYALHNQMNYGQLERAIRSQADLEIVAGGYLGRFNLAPTNFCPYAKDRYGRRTYAWIDRLHRWGMNGSRWLPNSRWWSPYLGIVARKSIQSQNDAPRH